MVPLKSGKWFAWSSSLLLLASGIASFWFWTSNHPHIETDDYQSLNVSSLKELWEWRREVLPYWFAIGALNTMGFLLLIPTSICLKKMFKGECPGMKTWSMVIFIFREQILPFLYRGKRKLNFYADLANTLEEFNCPR